jgi:hypothetical protein
VEEAGNTNSTCAASGGTETPAKKAEVMQTPEHQAFVHKFKPAVSKMDKPRKSQLGHISGRGASTKSFLMQQQDMKSVNNRLVRRKDLEIDTS